MKEEEDDDEEEEQVKVEFSKKILQVFTFERITRCKKEILLMNKKNN